MDVSGSVPADDVPEVEIDAGVLAEAFGIEPAAVLAKIREGAITSRSYRGVGEHAGTSRLVFFYDNARLTLTVDEAGTTLRQSLVDFGERPIPRSLHRP